MMVGIRLLLRVAKVTSTVADHSTRPPTKTRAQLGPLRGVRLWGSAVVVFGAASAASCVMARSLCWLQGSRQDGRVSSRPAAIFAGGCLESRAARYRRRLPARMGRAQLPPTVVDPSPSSVGRDYLSRPATRLMAVARMTAPSRYDSSAVARNAEVGRSVPETWKVIPTVKAG